MASAFRSPNTTRGAQILRGFDDEARGHVANAMQARGISIHCGTDVLRLEKTATGIRAIAHRWQRA